MNDRALNSLRIGNFKAFGEVQNVPVKPITLVFGPNSSGKSSLIHSLALANEAFRVGRLDIFRTEIGGTAIDLGGFRQYVHKTERSRRVEWGAELDAKQLTGILADRLGSVKKIAISVLFGLEGELSAHDLLSGLEHAEASPIFAGKAQEGTEAKVVVMSYDLSGDGESLAKMSRRRDGTLRLDQLNRTHSVFHRVLEAILLANTTTEIVSESDFQLLYEKVDRLVPEISARADRFLPEIILTTSARESRTDALLQPVSRGQRSADLAETLGLFFPRAVAELVNGVNEVVRKEVGAFTYLGPLRSFPPRHLAFAESEDRNWFAGGGYAWDVVRQDAEIRETVNRWLGAPALKTPYRIRVRTLFALDQMAKPLAGELDELVRNAPVFPSDETDIGYIAQLDDSDAEARQILKSMRDSNVDRINELVLIDQRTKTVVSHRDVGIGVSQVLPVLVAAYGLKGRIVAMEQPEIHLHPALQAELADVFIEAATGDRRNTFILETHSEHLVLRMLRRIREKVLRAEDLAILFVEPLPDRGSRVLEMKVDEDGDFIDRWPGGFFEESYQEKFAGR